MSKHQHQHYAELCILSYIYSGSKIGFRHEQIGNVVVISGSDSWHDWIDNFNVLPLRNFHKTYFKYAREIYNEIDITDDMTFVSHSAGGAIAHILAELVPNSKAISFGAPQIYSRKYLHRPDTHIAYQNVGDLVPQVRWGNRDNIKIIKLDGRSHDITAYARAILNYYEDTYYG